MTRRLDRAFYSRPAPVVARDLLGRVLVRMQDGTRLSGVVVETEAYEQDDPASHSFKGPTPRNEVMFGEPGFLYVYFTYGMHFCMNAVTGAAGEGSAVLIRAVEPAGGLDQMARNRGLQDLLLLCSGPARLCRAFGVARSENGTDLLNSEAIWFERGAALDDDSVRVTGRVGVSSASELPWRFLVVKSPYVSRGRIKRVP